MRGNDCWDRSHPHFFGMGGGPSGRGGHRGGRHHHRGGPPRWMKEMFHGGPRRAERGEVRYLILDALRDQPRHGYDVIQTIASKTGGAYRPSPGTVYPTLQMLEEMGHVAAREEDGRKAFVLTDDGRTDLDAHQDEVDDAYDRLGYGTEWDDDEDFGAVFKRIPRLMRTIGTAFRRGRLGAEEIAEVRRVIDEAIEKIEAIGKDSPQTRRKRRRRKRRSEGDSD